MYGKLGGGYVGPGDRVLFVPLSLHGMANMCLLNICSYHLSVDEARILEWVTIPYPRGSSGPGIEPMSPAGPALVSRCFNIVYLGSLESYPFALASVQFSSITQFSLTLCNPMDCRMPGLPVHQQLPEFTQTHVHWVSDARQPSHPLLSPSPPTFNLSQHQGLFKWVSSSHQVAKVLEFQLQHQCFQSIFRIHFR